MSLDITTTYIDTITGYLHNTLNELFKLKANYTVLEFDYEEVVKKHNSLQEEFGQTHVHLVESQKMIEELNTTIGKMKHEYATNNQENSSMKAKLSQLNVFSEQINNLKTTIAQKDEEIDNYIAMVAALRAPPKKKK